MTHDGTTQMTSSAGVPTSSLPPWSPHGAAPAGMASAFGATVDVAAPGSTLALVVGRPGGASPRVAVTAAGGRVLADLGGGRLLALVALQALLGLGQHPAVASAGPISVDPERFARFAALVDLDDPHAEQAQGPEGVDPR